MLISVNDIFCRLKMSLVSSFQKLHLAKHYEMFASRVLCMSMSTESKGCGISEKQAKIIKEKTPIGKLEDQPNVHPAQEKDPLPEFPDGVNPNTGEVGGPKGPEPTRYGDWERKGRVTDF